MVRAFKRQFDLDTNTGASGLAVRALRPQGHHVWWRSKRKKPDPLPRGPGFLPFGDDGYLVIL